MENEIFTLVYQLLSTVIKYLKGKFRKEGFLVAHTMRGTVSPAWRRRMPEFTAAPGCGSRNARLLAHILADQDHIQTITR